MEKIVDYSIVTKKNTVAIIFSVMTLAAMLAFTVYRWLDIGFLSPMEIMAELMIAFVLLDRAQARYTYELDKKVFRITKQGVFGKRVFEVPYRDVFGIYRYAPKLISVVKFSRTYRLHSALDGRMVWTLAYEENTGKGKKKNYRIYFKASDEFFNALNERLPNKVRIPEEEVMRDIILEKK